jgi:hypothetical protein
MRFTTDLPRRFRLAVLPFAVLLLGMACGPDGGETSTSEPGAGGGTPVRTPTQYVVAVDLSTSLTDTERGTHRALLDALVAGLDFGDRLVLIKAHQAGVKNATSTPQTVSMPAPVEGEPLQSDLDELELQRETAAVAVTSLFKNAALNGTDLLATMHTASEQARQGGGARTVLVVLSDMLQCTPGSFCMENEGGVPDSSWIDGQKAQSLIPPLDSVCVSVVGADASTARGVKVREFWSRYFQTAGASFSPSRYVHNASAPASLRCDA